MVPATPGHDHRVDAFHHDRSAIRTPCGARHCGHRHRRRGGRNRHGAGGRLHVRRRGAVGPRAQPPVRYGTSGDIERDAEEAARRYLDDHGHWPDEAPPTSRQASIADVAPNGGSEYADPAGRARVTPCHGRGGQPPKPGSRAVTLALAPAPAAGVGFTTVCVRDDHATSRSGASVHSGLKPGPAWRALRGRCDPRSVARPPRGSSRTAVALPPCRRARPARRGRRSTPSGCARRARR